MDEEMKTILNSLSEKEKKEFYKNTQNEVKSTLKGVGNGLKEEVQEHGIIGTLFRIGIGILLGGK